MTRGKKWIMAAAVLFALGVAAGSLAAVKTQPETLYEYFRALAGGEISSHTGTAVCDTLILWAVLFFSAFFRFGAVSCASAVAVKGFTDGYAVAAIFRILGVRGLGMCFFDILGAPLAIVMAAMAMCRLTSEERKNNVYLAAAGLLLVLMCASAAASSLAAIAIAKSVLAAAGI